MFEMNPDSGEIVIKFVVVSCNPTIYSEIWWRTKG